MDQVLANTLTANLKSADVPEAKIEALRLSMIALVECQLKTSQRVKTMWEDRVRAMWLGRVVWGFSAAGGFVCLVKVMKLMGVL